jgi:hypothetical protein
MMMMAVVVVVVGAKQRLAFEESYRRTLDRCVTKHIALKLAW